MKVLPGRERIISSPIPGLYKDNGKEHGDYCSIKGHIGRMEKNMEAITVYWAV